MTSSAATSTPPPPRSFWPPATRLSAIDTKEKELVGEYANKGLEWHPSGQPVEVNGHDFPAGVPKAIPYGIYGVGADDGFVSVGPPETTK